VRQRLRPRLVVMVVLTLVSDVLAVGDGAVQSGGVEPVDPTAGVDFEALGAAEGSVVADAFGLLEPNHALREGVLVAGPDRPDRRHSSGGGETVGVVNGRVLPAGVAAIPEPSEVGAGSRLSRRRSFRARWFGRCARKSRRRF
jgi:hypothetical protein